MSFTSGRHFLQIPGPTNLPDRILRAMDRPTIDHRGPEFAELGRRVLAGLKKVVGTSGPVVVYPSSGGGGWEAALVNTLSPGDKVLMFDHGVFAGNWCAVARRMGLDVDVVAVDWRRSVDPAVVAARLADDRERTIRAVAVVHNETSTGVTNRIDLIRRAIDGEGHPALFMVDTVSSLAAVDYRHQEWGVDVTVASSQKGLMLPPGLSVNAVSEKALAVHREAKLPRAYWDWGPMLAATETGFFPYTPATHLLFGLEEALAMLDEEGLGNVFARHRRLAEAARRAVAGWDLEVYCEEPEARSDTVTAVATPEGHDADALRRVILRRFDMSLGSGLGKLKGRVFRIGHLGSFNDLMLAGTLAGVEMGLRAAGVPHARGGVAAALDYLGSTSGGDRP